MLKLVGLSMLLAACGGSSRTCSATPDLSLVAGCIWNLASCSCAGEDMHGNDCSPTPCGANSSFSYVTCECEYPDLGTTD